MKRMILPRWQLNGYKKISCNSPKTILPNQLANENVILLLPNRIEQIMLQGRLLKLLSFEITCVT